MKLDIGSEQSGKGVHFVRCITEKKQISDEAFL